MLHEMHSTARHEFRNDVRLQGTTETKGRGKGSEMSALWMPGLLLINEKNK